MTLAVDKRTGRVIGQVVTLAPSAPLAAREGEINIYARGEYLRVPAASVRIETTR